MNVVGFIDRILITEIRMIQQDYTVKHTYLSFGLISQGIEFLGALTDEFELQMDQPGESKNRFNRALTSFFKSSYHPYADAANPFNFYKNLRCGMLHIVVPKNKLVLGERHYDSGKYDHLKMYKDSFGNDRLFLMPEDFYEDFKCACTKVIDAINGKSLFTMFPKLSSASTTKQDVINLKRDLLNIEI